MSEPTQLRLGCVRALRQGSYTAEGVQALFVQMQRFPKLPVIESELAAMVEDGQASREWVEKTDRGGNVTVAYWVYTLTPRGDDIELSPARLEQAIEEARGALRHRTVPVEPCLREIMRALVQIGDRR